MLNSCCWSRVRLVFNIFDLKLLSFLFTFHLQIYLVFSCCAALFQVYKTVTPVEIDLLQPPAAFLLILGHILLETLPFPTISLPAFSPPQCVQVFSRPAAAPGQSWRSHSLKQCLTFRSECFKTHMKGTGKLTYAKELVVCVELVFMWKRA